MSEKHQSSFSAVQIAAAWLIGLLLGGGAFGLVAFHSQGWGSLFVVPCGVATIITSISIGTYVANHWNDHN